MTPSTPTAMMAVVPRSDCERNRKPVGAATSSSTCTMNVRESAMPARKSENSFAAMRMSAILTNSEGCRLMGPKSSQRWAPSAVRPSSAVSSSNTTATPQTIQMAGPAHKRYGMTFHNTNAATMPMTAKMSWSVR